MSNAHIAGFNLLLTDGGVTVDDAETANFAVLPRVVEYPDQGQSTREALCAGPDGAYVTIQTTCVGATRDQAGLMLDKVRSLVENQRPVVASWACGPVQQLSSRLPERDDDVDPAVFYAVATWRFLAVPA